MRPLSPQIILLGLVLIIVIIIIQIELFSLVLTKLGLERSSATLLLVCTLIGSSINLPLIRVKSDFSFDDEARIPPFFPYKLLEGTTLILVNVGGGIIPATFSLYLVVTMLDNILVTVLAITIVSTISYLFSRPIAKIGIGMPLFIAPVSAAFTAMLLANENAAALAYVCGSLGVLIGADLLRIKDVKKLNSPVAAIGGAGTFDGIFLTGIIAVLLTF